MSKLKQQFILTKGLIASGKTTWAKQYCLEHPEFVNICKDDIRKTIKGEGNVIKERNRLTREALSHGKSIIWSDTNFNPVHEQTACQIASEYEIDFVSWKIFDTPLEECIKRDNARANGIGETAIRQMYNQYLRPEIFKPIYDPSIPNCIMVDIDGTLAEKGDRSPYDWSKVGIDTPNKQLIKLLKTITKGALAVDKPIPIIILSGRDSVCREMTKQWLLDNKIDYDDLFMRSEKDMRPDTVIKKEIYDNEIKGKYNVIAVFDDREGVCRQWYELGLPLYRVGDPDSNF